MKLARPARFATRRASALAAASFAIGVALAACTSSGSPAPNAGASPAPPATGTAQAAAGPEGQVREAFGGLSEAVNGRKWEDYFGILCKEKQDNLLLMKTEFQKRYESLPTPEEKLKLAQGMGFPNGEAFLNCAHGRFVEAVFFMFEKQIKEKPITKKLSGAKAGKIRVEPNGNEATVATDQGDSFDFLLEDGRWTYCKKVEPPPIESSAPAPPPRGPQKAP